MFLFSLLLNMVLLGSMNYTNSVSTNPNLILSPDENNISSQNPSKVKRKRNPPGNPDPSSEVLALSPKTLMATNRFICEFCQKGFPREQNLHLHKRSHNVDYELKPRSSREIRKRVYVCPESTCIHHHPSRALGDLTGIKKHYSRKHGEKKWMCENCERMYAIESDWKAHSKTCGTLRYQCECGTIFSRKDNFGAHRDSCVALAQENARISANTLTHQVLPPPPPPHRPYFPSNQFLPPLSYFSSSPHHHNRLFSANPNPIWDPPASSSNPLRIGPGTLPAFFSQPPPPPKISSRVGHDVGSSMAGSMIPSHFMGTFGQEKLTTWDFLGLTGEDSLHAGENVCTGTTSNSGLREVINFKEMSPEGVLTQMKGNGGAAF